MTWQTRSSLTPKVLSENQWQLHWLSVETESTHFQQAMQLYCRVRKKKKHPQYRNCTRNALWLPNLVGRTPDQSVMQCWVKGHAGVSWGQPEVKLLRNALWLPNLVGRTPDRSVMHCWGKRSCRGQLGSTRGQIALNCPMATKFGRKNPWPRCNALLGSKVMQGSGGVNRGQIA